MAFVRLATKNRFSARVEGSWQPLAEEPGEADPLGQKALVHAWKTLEELKKHDPTLATGVADKLFKVAAIKVVDPKDGKEIAIFPVKSAFLPGVFVIAEGSDNKLRSDLPSLVDKLVDAAAKQADLAKKEAIRAAKDALDTARARLRGACACMSVDVAAAGFLAFGAKSIAGQTALSAFVAVYADPILDGKIDETLLEIGLDAQAALGVPGVATAKAAVSLRLSITSNGILSLVPSIEPIDFPHIRVGFPDISVNLGDIVAFSLNGIPLPSLDRLLSLHLPLPALGTSPVRIHWTTAPTLAFKLDNGALSISTTTKGQGKIRLVDENKNAIKEIADLKDIYVALGNNDGIKLAGTLTLSATNATNLLAQSETFGAATEWLPFTVKVDPPLLKVDQNATIDLAKLGDAVTSIVSIAFPRVEIRAKEDPGLVLVFGATYTYEITGNGTGSGKLTKLTLLEPYPIELFAAAGKVLVGVIRLIGAVRIPAPTATAPDLRALQALLDRLGAFLSACLRYLGRISGAAGSLIAGIADEAFQALAQLFRLLKEAGDPLYSYVAIEVRLDASTFAVRQILISPAKGVQAGSKDLTFAGFTLAVPNDWTPTLLFDISGPLFVGLLAMPSANKLTLSTDLWLDRDGAATEAVRDVSSDEGKRPDKRLIQVTAWVEQAPPIVDPAIVLVALDDGRFSFLRGIANPPSDNVEGIAADQTTINVLKVVERPVLASPSIKTDVEFDVGQAGKLLPFFGSGGGDGLGDGLVDKLGRYVEIKKGGKAEIKDSVAKVPLECTIKLDGIDTSLTLTFIVDLASLRVRVETGDGLSIKGETKQGDFIGLTYVIEPAPDAKIEDKKFEQFRLDFRGGRPRMALSKQARATLYYRKIAAGGRGLVFRVSEFAVASGVFDIAAAIDPEEPITLPGVAMPFHFKSGSLVVRDGKLQDFALSGTGQLPDKLVGEAHATINLALGRDADGRLAVKSAEAELDKTGSPIVHRGTRTTLTVSKLGLGYEDFGNDGGYQFYFQVTGSIAFTPFGEEFSSSFLSRFRQIEIKLDRAPLGGDLKLLARAIQIQIALEPRVRFKLFEIFAFELRSIGFYPRAAEFGDQPTLFLGGKVAFMEAGDLFNARIDCDKLGIAPPKGNSGLPQIKFDGLSVGLSLNSLGTVEGTARVVDGRLKTIDGPDPLPSDVTAKGFLAAGRISLKGWASLAASMGFLELKREGGDAKHAFYLYGQAEALSISIASPIIPLYLREVGFGFGYRYTFAGLRRADLVTTPKALIEVLDDVSRYQGNLATFRAWEPEADGRRFTLAMRALFTVATASNTGEVSEAEGELPNPLLFDVAAALRSDATFLMTARVWLSLNYHTWTKSPERDDIMSRPPLRGYLYISAPRQEILARALSDRNGYLGTTPQLSSLVETAMRAVQWSATLYIRPGLWHVEMGWPYELKLEYENDAKTFGVFLEGGVVQRVEDFSYLNGIAFRGRGYAQFGGEVGSSSFGASIVARAEFEISGKQIAYISLSKPSASLYYGSIYYCVSVGFSIQIWLSFKILGKRITLRAGFSLYLSVTVLQEVVIGPSLLGARAQVTIAVSAFGRTLRLSVGIAFNDGDLDEARRRVERFLALGLTAVVPDPQKGLAAPAPAAVPAKQADAVIEKQADLSQTLAAQPAKLPDDVTGDPIGHPHYWAFLVELPEKPGTYVMQLVPRDRTEGTKTGVLSDDAGTFYPPSAWKTYFAGGDPNRGVVRLVVSDAGGPAEETVKDGNELTVRTTQQVNTGAPSAEAIIFGDVIDDGYVAELKCGASTSKLLQPRAQAITSVGPGSVDGRTTEETIRDASAALAGQSGSQAEWNRVEERRSAFVAAVMRGARRIAQEAQVAANGIITWPAREIGSSTEIVIDPRDLGLTFVVASMTDIDDTISGLFVTGRNEPPESLFKIRTTDPGIQLPDGTVVSPGSAQDSAVRLFNPPSRHFARARPRLARLETTPTTAGLRLCWDLEPAWGDATSQGAWDDPEHHLQHYVLERIVQLKDGGPAKLPVFRTTFKAASPLIPQKADKTISWARTPVIAQFVDDFADLPDPLKRALRLDFEAFEDGSVDAVLDGNVIRLAYRIQPVDTNGSLGLPVPIETFVRRPARPERALARVEAVVAFDDLPKTGVANGGALFIRLDDPEFYGKEKEQPQRLPPDGTTYRLWLRDELSPRRGLFGADALTRARQRPSPADLASEYDYSPDARAQSIVLTVRYPTGEGIEAKRRDKALDFIQVVKKTNAAPDKTVFMVEAGDFDRLANALGLAKVPDDKPAPIRLVLRRQSHPKKPEVVSPWMIADMAVHAGPVYADDLGRRLPRPIEAIVEVYERPFVAVWRPLGFDQLAGEAGRLMVTYPRAKATLANLLAPKPKKNPLLSLRDGERRIATRLKWAAAIKPDKDESPSDFIGGFDLFEIDLTGISQPMDQISTARHVGRAHLLDPELAKVDPAAIDDFAQVEAFYPSESLRLAKRKGPAQRRPWYSTAESLGHWPAPALRRAIGEASDDGVVTPLFERGKPDTIELAWSDDSKKKLASLKIEAELKVSGPAAALRKPLDVASIRTHVRSIAVEYNVLPTPLPPPGSLSGMTVVVVGKASQVETGRSELIVDLAPPVHGFIADILDALRWDASDEHLRRRYNVVIENAPATKAASLGEFLAERPVERDPYGWAILRVLGLATGLRLYDMETGDYLAPREALGLVDKAMMDVRKAYSGADIGAPFVDVLVRSGGAMRLATFDGGAPAFREDDTRNVVDDEALALLQISLRPTPDVFATSPVPAEDPSPTIAYAMTKGWEPDALAKAPDAAGPDTRRVTFTGTNLGKRGILVEVIDIAGGRPDGGAVLLSGTDDEVATAFAAGRSISATCSIDTTGLDAKLNPVIALIRVIWPPGVSRHDVEKALGLLAPGTTWDWVSRPKVAPDYKGSETTPDAYERFVPLSPETVAALLERRNAADKTLTGATNFAALAGRRWPKAETIDDNELARHVLDTAPRFLAHGAVVSPTSDDGKAGNPFAVATIPRPDPYRLKPGVDGMLETIMVHKDRRARRRRYMVRPFGRYDALVEAWHGAFETKKDEVSKSRAIPWVARRDIADSIEGFARPAEGAADVPLPTIGLGSIDTHAVDIGVPRSEKLARPVVLSARRLDTGEGNDRRPGRTLEFVVARHSEDLLSEANSATADALQFEHVAYGFYREYAHPEWLAGLSGTDGLDVLDQFGPGTIEKAPQTITYGDGASFGATDGLLALPERLPDGWRGITALRTWESPHFFKLYLVAFAAAGVVVSEPAVATIPEGHYEIHWPWENGLTGAIGERPVWWIARETVDDRPQARLKVMLPLIRHLDGMPEPDRTVWLTKGIPPVFRLPEPLAVYELATVRHVGANGMRTEVEVSPEVELLPSAPSGTSSDSVLLVKMGGPRFAVEAPSPASPAQTKPKIGQNSPDWIAELSLVPSAAAPFTLAFKEAEHDSAKQLADRLQVQPDDYPRSTLSFVSPVELKTEAGAMVTAADADKAIDVFRGTSLPLCDAGEGFEEAIAVLQGLKAAGSPPPGRWLLPLPFTATRTGHRARVALDAFVATVKIATGQPAATITWDTKPDRIVLRRPPTDEDLVLLARLAGPDEATKDLAAAIRAAASDQLFGIGRSLRLKAARGLLDPITSPLERRS